MFYLKLFRVRSLDFYLQTVWSTLGSMSSNRETTLTEATFLSRHNQFLNSSTTTPPSTVFVLSIAMEKSCNKSAAIQ